jgi:hypothetical protein
MNMGKEAIRANGSKFLLDECQFVGKVNTGRRNALL